MSPATPPYTGTGFAAWADAERTAATADADAAAAALLATLPPAAVSAKAAACRQLELSMKRREVGTPEEPSPLPRVNAN